MQKDGKKVYAFDQVVESDWADAESWEKLGHVNVIRDWALELVDAVMTLGDAEQSQLVGRAVTIIHDDVDYCSEIYRRVASDVGLQYVVIPPEKVFSIFHHHDGLCNEGPQLIYLEPGPWMEAFNADTSPIDKKAHEAMHQKICNLIVDSDYFPPFIIGTSTHDYETFDVKFRQAHLFSRRFAIPPPSFEENASIFIESIGITICDETLTGHLQKVGKLLELEFNDKRRQGIVALALKRLAKRESRNVSFKDLVHFAVNGTLETDQVMSITEDSIRRVAIHEAGHTVIAVVDSEGANIPDYVSAIPTHAHKGVVAESFSFNLRSDEIKSYRNMRHKVRVCLAGRAAEQLILGAEEVSCHGANEDLQSATKLCGEMFAVCGMSPHMEDEESAGNNLMVLTAEASLSDHIRVDKQVSAYLKKQYKIVLDQLRSHQHLLDHIINELTSNKLLNQEELIEICADYRLNASK